MNDDVKKKISLIDELMIEDINNLSISELEENISALKMIIDKYFEKIEDEIRKDFTFKIDILEAVSYTHLTLPTKA